jgi:hypothetical protein
MKKLKYCQKTKKVKGGVHVNSPYVTPKGSPTSSQYNTPNPSQEPNSPPKLEPVPRHRSRQRHRSRRSKPKSKSRGAEAEAAAKSKSKSPGKAQAPSGPRPPSGPPPKLRMPASLESKKYETTEPDFWKPMFDKNEMTEFKTNLQAMMKSDCKQLNKSGDWSICQMNKTLISTYFIPQKKELKIGRLKDWNMDSDIDFTRYNVLLCAALMVFGVISMKMKGQPYELILKGGKAIQLVLADANYPMDYKTEDIDILIRPKKGYHAEDVKFITSQVAYLVQWFLEDSPFFVSVQTPEESRLNKFIYKLSYIKDQKGYDYETGEKNINMYNPFSDLDFKELPARIQPFFKYSYEKEFPVPALKQVLFFRCPDISSLLYEKLYYYSKYESFLFNGGVTDPDYEGTTSDDCKHFMDKFKPAILALNQGLVKEGKNYGYEDPTFPIQTRLIHLGFGPNHPGTVTHRLLGLLQKVDKKE